MQVSVVWTLLRIFLSVALTLAAAAKTLDIPGFRKTLGHLGVSEALTLPVTAGVIALEVVVSAGVWVAAMGSWFSLCAVALLFSFSTVALMYRRRAIKCNCFGPLTDDTLGWRTVARNAFLLLMALPLAVSGQTGALPLEALTPVSLAVIGILYMLPLLRPIIRR